MTLENCHQRLRPCRASVRGGGGAPRKVRNVRLVAGIIFTSLFSAAASAQTAPPAAAPSPKVTVHTSVSRTAIWVGDRILYTIDFVCPHGVDVLDEDMAREKLKLDGLDVVNSDSSQGLLPNDTTTHQYRYWLTTYRVDVPVLKIEPTTVRYYVRRPGQRLQDAGAAGDVQIPGTVIAFRSMLPDNQESYELRDGLLPMPRPALAALAQPIGVGLVVASIVPAAFWAVAFVQGRRHRVVKRSARQVQHEEKESLDAVRALDLSTADGRREAYTRLDGLVRQHLREVCNIPGQSLTPPEVSTTLAHTPSRLPAELVSSVLTSCEQARYAPPQMLPSADACREAFDQAAQVLATR